MFLKSSTFALTDVIIHPYLNYKLPDECNNTGCSLLRIREIFSFITQVNGKSFLAALIQFRHSDIVALGTGRQELKQSHMVSLVAVESFLPLVNVYISGGGFKAVFKMFVPILGEVIQFDYYLSIDLKPASRCWIFCLEFEEIYLWFLNTCWLFVCWQGVMGFSKCNLAYFIQKWIVGLRIGIVVSKAFLGQYMVHSDMSMYLLL